METFLENEQLILLNIGEYTRHNTTHNFLSAIDLTITNSTFAPKTEWNVLNEYSSSNHWPISIKIKDQTVPISLPVRWNLNHKSRT